MSDAKTPHPALPTPHALVRFLAIAAGLSVANLYYCQPLLPAIGRDLGLSGGRAGYVSTATQVGYAIGLLLFVPLGDMLERRRLMSSLLVAVALALGAAALAPSLAWLLVASVVIGATTVVPQLIVPYGAGLAGPEGRGRVVGQIMGGLLVGILAARVVSGALGAVIGWRWMFALAGLLMLGVAVAIWRRIPESPPAAPLSYPALLRSLAHLARAEPVLRDAATIGALVFVAFSAFWTTLAFRLLEPPLHYGSAVAGLFGIVGVVGASAAPMVGRLADRRTPRDTVGIGLAILGLSYVELLVAGHTIAGLIVGVIVLDAAIQAVNVSNQTRVYRLPAPLHNRLNTVYMGTYFIGGSIGSALGVWAWGQWRWPGVCGVTIGATVAALLLYALGRYRGVE